MKHVRIIVAIIRVNKIMLQSSVQELIVWQRKTRFMFTFCVFLSDTIGRIDYKFGAFVTIQTFRIGLRFDPEIYPDQ